MTTGVRNYETNSLGVHQLPVAMRGPQGMLCFLTSTTPGGSKKVGWPLIL